MIDRVLTEEEGVITHSVFKAGEDDDGEGDGDGDGEDDDAEKKQETDILKTFKHQYIAEVVREKKIHFQKVPRLGAFMAIPLCYNSCLFDDALQNAVEDYSAKQKEIEEQDKKKAEWEDAQA